MFPGMKTPEIGAMVAVMLFGLYQLGKGLTTGELTMKRKTARRDEEPFFFWLFMAFWVFIEAVAIKASLFGFPIL